MILDIDALAVLLNRAATAERGNWDADRLPKRDEQIIEVIPVPLREDAFECMFCFFWRACANPPQSVWDAVTVGVNGEVPVFLVSVDHDDVRGFSADSLQGEEAFHSVWYAPVVLLVQGTCYLFDSFGFRLVETNWVNQGSYLFFGKTHELLRCMMVLQ